MRKTQARGLVFLYTEANKSVHPKRKQKTVVVMGGGTGTYTVLSALRAFPQLDLKAIIAMTDDGGSTGVLRDEMGVLPPGDIRQCLVALSEAPEKIRELMNYRFENGGLHGHSFGNLFLSALEKVTGSFQESVDEISRIIKIKGEIIPITLDNVKLEMTLKNGAVLKGERVITPSEVIQPIGIKKYVIKPLAHANPRAIKAIMAADAVIIGPGNLYTSMIPLVLVPGIAKALRRSHAKKILIVNLMDKFGQTERFTPEDYMHECERFAGMELFDIVVCNQQSPSGKQLERYFRREKSHPVMLRGAAHQVIDNRVFLGGSFLDHRLGVQKKSDNLIARNLIRHDQRKLGAFLLKLF